MSLAGSSRMPARPSQVDQPERRAPVASSPAAVESPAGKPSVGRRSQPLEGFGDPPVRATDRHADRARSAFALGAALAWKGRAAAARPRSAGRTRPRGGEGGGGGGGSTMSPVPVFAANRVVFSPVWSTRTAGVGRWSGRPARPGRSAGAAAAAGPAAAAGRRGGSGSIGINRRDRAAGSTSSIELRRLDHHHRGDQAAVERDHQGERAGAASLLRENPASVMTILLILSRRPCRIGPA